MINDIDDLLKHFLKVTKKRRGIGKRKRFKKALIPFVFQLEWLLINNFFEIRSHYVGQVRFELIKLPGLASNSRLSCLSLSLECWD